MSISDFLSVEEALQGGAKETTVAQSEKMFYMAGFSSIATGENPATVYNNLQQQNKAGIASASTAIQSDLVKRDEEIKEASTLSILASDMSVAEKQKALSDMLQARTTPKDAYIEEQIAGAYKDPERQQTHVETVFDRLKSQAEIQKLYNDYQIRTDNTFSEDFSGGLAGVGEILTPMAEAAHVNALAWMLRKNEYWKDAEHSLSNIATFGSLKENLHKHLLSLPELDRPKAVKALIHALENTAGTEFVDADILDSVLYGNPDWVTVVEDLAGTVDTVLPFAGRIVKVGGTALKRILSGSPNPKSPWQVTATTNPDAGAKLSAAAIIDETGQVAKAAGTTREEIVAHAVYPGMDKDLLKDAPTDVVDVVERIRQGGDELLQDAKTAGFILEKGDKAKQVAATATKIEAATKLKAAPNHSVIKEIGNAFEVSAKYTDGAGLPFKSLNAAKKAAAHLPEGSYRIVRKGQDKWQEIKVTGVKGEYFIELNYKQDYDPNAVLAWGSDAVGWKAGPLSGKGSKLFRELLLDPTSRLSPLITKAGERAADIFSRTEHKLVADLQTSFKGMKKDSVQRVSQFIQDGNRVLTDLGKAEFSYRDLVNPSVGGLSAREAKAVLSFQETNKILYKADDAAYTKAMNRKGYKWIVDSELEGAGRVYGRPIGKDDVAVREFVTNLSNGTTARFSAKEIDEIYEQGGSIVRLERSVYKGTDKFEYAIIDGVRSQIKELPKQGALPFRPMHYRRYYDEYYKVEAVAKQGKVNGRGGEVKNTVAMHGSMKEAKEFAAKMADDPDWDYTATRLDEAEYGDEAKLFRDVAGTADGSYQRTSKKRGEHLEGAGPEGLAYVEDPLQSIFRAIQSTAQHVATDDVLSMMKAKTLATFEELRTVKDFPTDVKELRKAGLSGERLTEAANIVDYINTISRTPGKYKRQWNESVLWLAENLESVFSGKASRAVKDTLLDRNPLVDIPKHIGFMRYIQGRPLRQFILQSSQILQYAAFEPKYWAHPGHFPRQLLGALRALSTGNIDGAAKLAGLPKQELQDILNIWDRSGLGESVKSHQHVSRATRNTFSNAVVSRPGSPAEAFDKWIMSTLGKGFEAGEGLNLLAALLVARQRFIKKGNKIDIKNTSHLHEIASDARGLALSMNQGGRTTYQNGWLSAALQFASAPHKAVLAATTNRRFTPAEKGKLIAWNMALFGEYAFSMSRLIEKADDVLGTDLAGEYPEEWESFKKGLLHVALNELLVEEGSVDFTSAVSPTEGSIFVDVVSGMSERPPLELIAGAGGRASVSYIEDLTKRMTSLYGDVTYDTPTKIKEGLFAVGSFATALTDYEKMQFARNSGWFANSKGDLTVQATKDEAFFKIFGFSSDDEVQLRKFNNRSFARKKDLKEAAKWYADQITYLHNLKGTVDEVDKRILLTKNRFTTLNPEDRNFVLDETNRLLTMKAKAGVDSAYNSIIKDIMRPDIDRTYLKRQIRDFPSSDLRDKLKRIYENAFNEEL